MLKRLNRWVRRQEESIDDEDTVGRIEKVESFGGVVVEGQGTTTTEVEELDAVGRIEEVESLGGLVVEGQGTTTTEVEELESWLEVESVIQIEVEERSVYGKLEIGVTDDMETLEDSDIGRADVSV
ncbi:MAG: hypothetical protein Q9227_000017 [Pyrenula ochraceoflavens]